MAVPQVQVALTMRVLRKSGDPDPAGDVSSLQFMLAFVGGFYSPFDRALRASDGVDGLFGPRTEQRVRQFQANENLTVDGIVGKNTWTTLLERWTQFQQPG